MVKQVPVTEDMIVIGRVTSAFGIKGWVKVFSHTEPKENIFEYQPWLMAIGEQGQLQTLDISQWRKQAKGLVVQLDGCDDRTLAENYCGRDILAPANVLPELEVGDFYWSDLQGLSVVTEQGELLGKVQRMLATGANDVMVVRACSGSVDDQERLIPYQIGYSVIEVDLESGQLTVNWQLDY